MKYDPDARMSHWVQLAGKQARLTSEQEAELLERFQRGDRAAGDRVARSLLAFVVYTAKSFVRYSHVTLDDLVAVGNVGLLTAMRKFETGRGLRLISYAQEWIRCEIWRLIMRDWSIVVGGENALRGMVFHKTVRAYQAAQAITGDHEQAVELAAHKCGISADRFRKRLARITDRDLSLDTPMCDGASSRISYLPAYCDMPDAALEAREEAERTKHLARTALACLTTRQREIVGARLMDDRTRSRGKIGREFGISRERVRQVENRAMGVMRDRIECAQRETRTVERQQETT